MKASWERSSDLIGTYLDVALFVVPFGWEMAAGRVATGAAVEATETGVKSVAEMGVTTDSVILEQMNDVVGGSGGRDLIETRLNTPNSSTGIVPDDAGTGMESDERDQIPDVEDTTALHPRDVPGVPTTEQLAGLAQGANLNKVLAVLKTHPNEAKLAVLVPLCLDENGELSLDMMIRAVKTRESIIEQTGKAEYDVDEELADTRTLIDELNALKQECH